MLISKRHLFWGSETDWNNISIGINNESLTNATIHYGSQNSDNNNTLDDSQRSANSNNEVIDVNLSELPNSLYQFVEKLDYGMSWFRHEEYYPDRPISGGISIFTVLRHYGIDYKDYPGLMTVNKGLDPLGKLGMDFNVYNGDKVDWILKNVFNCSDENIHLIREFGESSDNEGDKYYYYEGNYYTWHDGWGDDPTDFEIESVKYDGTFYHVIYNLWAVDFQSIPSIVRTNIIRHAYVKLRLKAEGNREYWSVYQWSKNAPDNVKYEINEPVQHIIAGTDNDNNNNNTFTFNEGEEIEDLVFSMPSTKYNPRLAFCLAQMARSAYNEELLKKNLSELGFGNIDHNEFSDVNPLAGYYIAQRKQDDGSNLVLITIRGSTGMQWLTDFAFGEQLFHDGWHSGFSLCVKYLFADLKADLMNSIPTENTTYVITGHSLGGAVSNLLAVLLDDVGVPNANVYCYNYGCPNVAIGSDDISSWNDDGEHNNIINVGNYFDQVTYVPNKLFEGITIDDWKINYHAWKKYGVSYWLDDGFHFANYAHDMQSYVDYLAKLKDESEFRTSEFSIPAFGFSGRCPIDFVIYNSAGEKVAGVINNEAQYYDKEIGEEAIIFVNGGKKLFYLFGDDDYSVRATATDQGEMNLDVAKFDLVSGAIGWIKSYESVNLVSGKSFSCDFGKTISASDISLYVTNEGGKPIREVREDGNEVEIVSNTTEIIENQPDIAENTEGEGVSPEFGLIIAIISIGVALIVIAAIMIFVKKKQ